jgi:hypothetical protein
VNRADLVVELPRIDLEFRLLIGEPARAADYLERFPEFNMRRDAANDRILNEFRLRNRSGRKLNSTQFLTGYPERHSELFRMMDTLTPPDQSLDPPAFKPVIAGLEIE